MKPSKFPDEPSFRLFVYGTLCQGERNHHLLAGAVFLGEGKTPPRYELRDLGGYPALIPGGETAVRGEIYQVPYPLLQAIDELEECPEFYQRTIVELVDGTLVWVYLMDRQTAPPGEPIPTGHWPTWRQGSPTPHGV